MRNEARVRKSDRASHLERHLHAERVIEPLVHDGGAATVDFAADRVASVANSVAYAGSPLRLVAGHSPRKNIHAARESRGGGAGTGSRGRSMGRARVEVTCLGKEDRIDAGAKESLAACT